MERPSSPSRVAHGLAAVCILLGLSQDRREFGGELKEAAAIHLVDMYPRDRQGSGDRHQVVDGEIEARIGPVKGHCDLLSLRGEVSQGSFHEGRSAVWF